MEKKYKEKVKLKFIVLMPSQDLVVIKWEQNFIAKEWKTHRRGVEKSFVVVVGSFNMQISDFFVAP